MRQPEKTASQPARRTLLLGGGLLVAVILIFILGKLGFLPRAETLNAWMETVAGSPWGLPALIMVFCIAAFLGVPQFALIAAAVALFGPWLGFAYAWIANMFSGSLTFWVGRLAGEQVFRQYAGATANRLALIAFAGQSLFAALKGNPGLAILAAFIAAAIYGAIALYARTRMGPKGQSVPLITDPPVDTGDKWDD